MSVSTPQFFDKGQCLEGTSMGELRTCQVVANDE